MDKRGIGGIRVPMGSLTGDAPDRGARVLGRGERGHRRPGGGVAVPPDSLVPHIAHPGSLLRPSPRCRRTMATDPPLDGDTDFAHALGTAARVALTLTRGHRNVVTQSIAESAAPIAPA